MSDQAQHIDRVAERCANGQAPTAAEAAALAKVTHSEPLLDLAGALRDEGHGDVITYSKKVFIPLTRLCRDVCGYCTFAQPPKNLDEPYLNLDEVLRIAERGARAGCREALFTLGDKPERRYAVARRWLSAHGYADTLAYLREAADLVHAETGLLPHLNPGVLTRGNLAMLREVAPSMGLMLESSAARLCARGQPHAGSPDKVPSRRIATIARAGKALIPFTTGILIGIGETRSERIESLLVLRDLHRRFGHIQEIIIQNFRAKPGTRMADAAEPSLADLLWTVAVTRILFGPEMNIQVPPNLNGGELARLVRAGINDWGGVSPVTIDFVNPEAPWPSLEALARDTAASGKELHERLTIYPQYARDPERWTAPRFQVPLRRMVDAEGLPRSDGWIAGAGVKPPAAAFEWVQGPTLREPATEQARTNPGPPTRFSARPGTGSAVSRILDRAMRGDELRVEEIVQLFRTRGPALTAVCRAADALRRECNGDTVGYVVNRNINYTNICQFRCRFCAFSKGRSAEDLRGRPYDLDLEEIMRRTREAWDRGATEVCMQGGIHPAYTGETYLNIVRATKEAAPDIHVHAFSPLEIRHGAETLRLDLDTYLKRLHRAGLDTLPGTAAEILDDEVRRVLCPDKLTTAQWLEVMEAAHRVGLRSTATIMFGHLDRYEHWARHLLRIRALQKRTGGFTEFVPLPFVHMEAPMYRKGLARMGPTLREAILIHSVARLTFNSAITNIQTSWVKMGHDGVRLCLKAGCNDLGGTLMNESISRAAGASHGQETSPQQMMEMIRSVGGSPWQRTTLYTDAVAERRETALRAAPLEMPLYTSAARCDEYQEA